MMYKHLSVPLMLALGLVASNAIAAEWTSFGSAFPVFPCGDGWSACIVDGQSVDADFIKSDGAFAIPSSMRLDWDTLEVTAAFSPFSSLSEYTGEAPAPPVVQPPPKEAIAPPPRQAEPIRVVSHEKEVPEAVVADSRLTERAVQPAAVVKTEPAAVVKTELVTGNSSGPYVPPSLTAEPPKQVEPVVKNEVNAPIIPAQKVEEPPVVKPTKPIIPAVAVVEPPVVKPPVDDGPVTCDNVPALEPKAMMGKLSKGEVGCLQATIGATGVQTEKDRVSRVLMANAWASGDRASWEKLVQFHLEEIDRSDPDICYKYALFLSKKGTKRSNKAIKWADVALENKTRWSGSTYTSRVFNLYKLRAAAAHKLWGAAEKRVEADPSDKNKGVAEKARNITKTYAREWFEYAKDAGKDTTRAFQLCASAAGTTDFCEAG